MHFLLVAMVFHLGTASDEQLGTPEIDRTLRLAKGAPVPGPALGVPRYNHLHPKCPSVPPDHLGNQVTDYGGLQKWAGHYEWLKAELPDHENGS